jgi:hypothetical protein
MDNNVRMTSITSIEIKGIFGARKRRASSKVSKKQKKEKELVCDLTCDSDVWIHVTM